MIQAHAHSETGPVRTVNEDSWLIQPDLGLYAVADGMGGHNAGEVASRLAIDALSGFVGRSATVNVAGGQQVVFNNGALGFVELEQKATGILSTGTDLHNPNFAAMAEAIGIRGIRLEDPTQVESGIADAFAHDGPVLVDAVVNRTELAMPPAITVEMAKGFSLYMVKAVMNGRTDEIVDLAKSNLWR